MMKKSEKNREKGKENKKKKEKKEKKEIKDMEEIKIIKKWENIKENIDNEKLIETIAPEKNLSILTFKLMEDRSEIKLGKFLWDDKKGKIYLVTRLINNRIGEFIQLKVIIVAETDGDQIYIFPRKKQTWIIKDEYKFIDLYDFVKYAKISLEDITDLEENFKTDIKAFKIKNFKSEKESENFYIDKWDKLLINIYPQIIIDGIITLANYDIGDDTSSLSNHFVKMDFAIIKPGKFLFDKNGNLYLIFYMDDDKIKAKLIARSIMGTEIYYEHRTINTFYFEQSNTFPKVSTFNFDYIEKHFNDPGKIMKKMYNRLTNLKNDLDEKIK
jgi:hypothetical protein